MDFDLSNSIIFVIFLLCPKWPSTLVQVGSIEWQKNILLIERLFHPYSTGRKDNMQRDMAKELEKAKKSIT